MVAQAGRCSVPHLFVWGDHLALEERDSSWVAQYRTTRKYHEALLAAGARSTWLHLPERGIRGNSHMLMMDDNSTDILGLIHGWITTHVEGGGSPTSDGGPRG